MRKWPLGFGVLYIMINFPFVFFTKQGITGTSISKRERSIDKDMPGVPVTIMFVVIPFCYQVEQIILFITWPLYFRFYKGDGSTEWRLLVGWLLAYLMLRYYWFNLYKLFEYGCSNI